MAYKARPTQTRVPVRGSIGKRVPLPQAQLAAATATANAALAAVTALGVTVDLPAGFGGSTAPLPIYWQQIQYVPPNVRYAPIFMQADDPEDGGAVVPGPAGKAGAAGSAGATGPPGQGLPLWIDPPDPDDPQVIPGSPGPAGGPGAAGANGAAGVGVQGNANILDWEFEDWGYLNRDISGSGDVNVWSSNNTFTSPTGVPVKIIAPTLASAGQYGLSVTASGTTSQSFGAYIQGGTNINDNALLVQQSGVSAKTLLQIKGDGSGFVGLSGAFIGWTSTGLVTVNATNSGVAFTVTGGTGVYTTLVNNPSAAGSSNGLKVEAGGNSSDVCATFVNQANTTAYLQIYGDGGVTVGGAFSSTALNDFGKGTINVLNGLYVNNVPLRGGQASAMVNLQDFEQDDPVIMNPPYPTDLVRSGSITMTITGCTTAPTGVAKWWRFGNIVILLLPVINATSNTAACTFTYTNEPLIQPVTTQFCSTPNFENASAFTGICSAEVSTAGGSVVFAINGSASGFTNSGTKGLSSACVIVYSAT